MYMCIYTYIHIHTHIYIYPYIHTHIYVYVIFSFSLSICLKHSWAHTLYLRSSIYSSVYLNPYLTSLLTIYLSKRLTTFLFNRAFLFLPLSFLDHTIAREFATDLALRQRRCSDASTELVGYFDRKCSSP